MRQRVNVLERDADAEGVATTATLDPNRAWAFSELRASGI
jgi:hypothetical protein